MKKVLKSNLKFLSDIAFPLKSARLVLTQRYEKAKKKQKTAKHKHDRALISIESFIIGSATFFFVDSFHTFIYEVIDTVR